MYYVIYVPLYLLSLVPLRLLYLISDAVYVVLYYIIGYRKEVVINNLLIAFPNKTEKERLRIAKDFYHNFLDSFIEMIKLVSITEKQFRKRVTGNFEVVTSLEGKVPNVSFVSAHFFNWEFANLASSLQNSFQLISVYMPVKNKAVEKILLGIREKFGAKLIPAIDYRKHFIKYSRTNFSLGLIADQNPGNTLAAYWIPFFGKLTPFVKGPEKSSKSNNSAVVFVRTHKTKRGHYNFEYMLVTTDPKSYTEGTLTKELIKLTEETIKKNPSNYLWSHRRWKWEYNEEKFGKLVVK